jgi:hypothetical protein
MPSSKTIAANAHNAAQCCHAVGEAYKNWKLRYQLRRKTMVDNQAANVVGLELYYSRFTAVLVMMVALGVTATSGMTLVGLMMQKGFAVIGWIGIAIFAPVLFALYRFSLRALFRTTPVVVFDADGVTDTRNNPAFVPWTDIGNISLGWGNPSYHYLRFEFRTADIAKQYMGRASGFRVLALRTQFLGDWNIYLLTLRCSKFDVLRAAKRLHQHSVAEMVNSVNQGGARDLFVVDRRE